MNYANTKWDEMPHLGKRKDLNGIREILHISKKITADGKDFYAKKQMMKEEAREKAANLK